MKQLYTVSGLHAEPESTLDDEAGLVHEYQRYTHAVYADSPQEAERIVQKEHGPLLIASVVAGNHEALDAEYATYSTEDGAWGQW